MNDELIYLDWAATAPLSEAAARAMAPYLQPGIAGLVAGGGNANSLHGAGRAAFKALEAARHDIARALGVRSSEIIFTSGATEADNLALVGIVSGVLKKQGIVPGAARADGAVPSVIVSAIEHDAVLQAAFSLRRFGIEVILIRPNRAGIITQEALEDALAQAAWPVLVSVMAVNNETGALMDISALSRTAHEAGALFHTDATQALGKVPLDLSRGEIDALSLSSHKIGGPKGVGALYLKTRTPFVAQIAGGGQESNRRSGTQNIAGVVGFAAALEEALGQLPANAAQMARLRDRLFTGLAALRGVAPVVDPTAGTYAPHIVAVMCEGFESETLILQLDRRGVCASGGSACSSASLEPSHVLSAMGIARDRALGMLRFSLGPETTEDDIDAAIEALREVLETTWN